MKRVSILGTSGSGKTTLGRYVAERLGGTAIDLDELSWEPGWQKVAQQEFERRLAAALEAPAWVTSGNYSSVQEMYMTRADTVVWLDYSFPVVFYRVCYRTWRRAVRGESCCNGNYESVRRTFSKESVVLWVLKTYRCRRRQCDALFAAPPREGITLVRHRSPRETRRWLNSIPPP